MSKTLLENFYTENETKSLSEENSFETVVTLNAEHPIYKGHFPEVPVAPGVTLVQLIQELVEKKANTKLFLREGSNIKFLAMVNPQIENVLKISYTFIRKEKFLDTTATISGKENIYVKFKGTFETQ